MRKLRPREVKQLGQDHTELTIWKNWDLNLGYLPRAKARALNHHPEGAFLLHFLAELLKKIGHVPICPLCKAAYGDRNMVQSVLGVPREGKQ